MLDVCIRHDPDVSFSRDRFLSLVSDYFAALRQIGRRNEVTKPSNLLFGQRDRTIDAESSSQISQILGKAGP